MIPLPRDPHDGDRAEHYGRLDDLADALTKIRDLTADRDYWRAAADGTAARRLDAIEVRCIDVVNTREEISGFALAIDLLGLCGQAPPDGDRP